MASRYVAQARLASLCARRRALVLTYDDGPGELTTPDVFEVLGGVPGFAGAAARSVRVVTANHRTSRQSSIRVYSGFQP